MCIVNERLEYVVYESPSEINQALDIIRFTRIYMPGQGLIFRMCKIRHEYQFYKIVIVYAWNEHEGLMYKRAIGCIVTDRKVALPQWSTYSIDENMPNEYIRINVWVKPKYRKLGIGKALMAHAQVNDLWGVECYDTGPAARKLYGNLAYSRLT